MSTIESLLPSKESRSDLNAGYAPELDMAKPSVHACGNRSNLVHPRHCCQTHRRKEIQSFEKRSTSESNLKALPQKGLDFMTVRMLTTETRRRIEEVLNRLGAGETVSLEERIQLKKYAIHIPFVAGKLTQALRKREALETDGLI